MAEIRTIEGVFAAGEARFALVASRFNSFVVESLIAGAVDTLRRHGVADAQITLVRSPGAFELPLVVQKVAASGNFDAIVALGAVIRGGTPHFDYVCQGVTQGLTDVSVRSRVPVGFGVLTTDDEAQALDRAGLPGSSEDKGAEAVEAAVATAVALRAL